jgi:hypothetical protein
MGGGEQVLPCKWGLAWALPVLDSGRLDSIAGWLHD